MTDPVRNNPDKRTAKIALRMTKLTGLLVLLLLSGCLSRLGHLPKDAKVDVPHTWEKPELPTLEPEIKETVVPPEPEPESVKNGWLNSFDDTELNKHVQVALENNPDLWSSAAQLKSAIEQVTITGSSLWPNLRAVGNSSSNENTQFDSNSESSGVTTEIRTVSGTLDIAWEADIWGKLTQRKRAAAYSAKAQAELFKAAELSLVANVSRAWYNLVTNKLQLDLAHQRLDSFKRTAELIEENYQRGLRSALDVYLSRTDVQTQLSSLSDSQFNYIRSLRAFKTLLGSYPDTNLEFSSTLPELDNSVSTGLPAQLLTRRPDIKASQLQYKAQIATVKAANRDRYPSITFNGSLGDSRTTFNQMFENDSAIRSLLASVTQPIFQSGALKSREEQAFYQAESAYASLVKTTLTAFEEVENSLSQESLLFEQHRAIKKAVKLAQGGLDLALDRYQSGIENYTTVLQSQRSLFDSRRNELNIRNALLQNRIGLHLALGGSFSDIENRNPIDTLPSPVEDSKSRRKNEAPAEKIKEQGDTTEIEENSETETKLVNEKNNLVESISGQTRSIETQP